MYGMIPPHRQNATRDPDPTPRLSGVHGAMQVQIEQLDLYVSQTHNQHRLDFVQLSAMVPSWYSSLFFDTYQREKSLENDQTGKELKVIFKNLIVSTPLKTSHCMTHCEVSLLTVHSCRFAGQVGIICIGEGV